MSDFETIGGLVSDDLDLFFIKLHKVVLQVLNMIKWEEQQKMLCMHISCYDSSPSLILIL